ncbi:MAG: hypothetical protein A2Y62_03700 [Candidatus Fischerbacteria bacterium RBG_13_37_8]|uniref:HMA domain-containing protein n=1 Tax=Candidatus Fischerbacteria bacterium RBG_13_37_8 TaxID=1817863 RepID=A0A1F5V7Z7_9BACT|nr:MAG: hypothetical protein A2Y62_03700 [Candidatus Fischerbacteria bacterium RBG_13_37_8]
MKIVFKVPDISCEHCHMTLTKAVSKIENVTNVSIDLTSKEVTVEGVFKKEEVVQAIKEAGYTVQE